MFAHEMPEIRDKYPGLRYITYPAKKRYLLEGRIAFEAEYNGVYIADDYQIQITWDEECIIPCVSETGGRISREYPHRYPDDSLCLAAPAELFRHFAEAKGLSSFIENFVISYLFTYSYWEKYGAFPYGDRSHGAAGEIEYFKELLDVDSEDQIGPFLEKISANGFRYKGREYCPCGSGHLMNSCRHKGFLVHLPPQLHLQYCLDRYRKIQGEEA